MADEQNSSSWWGYASSAWNVVQETVQETAKDFTDAFQEENEETIQQIKTKVDAEHISNQISNATTSINTFLNTTLNTTLTNHTAKPQDIKIKKQIQPKPFEKEKATYTLDPCSIKQHKDKYKSFIEEQLGLTDDEICVKGRHLLEINGAIRTYFQQLVPDEIKEITFWKRYFYWKYNHQLREILISRHTKPNKSDTESDKDEEEEDEEEEEEEVKLGDCENARISDEDRKESALIETMDRNDDTNNDKNTNGNTEECSSTYASDAGASGSKLSETSSWTHVIEDTNTIHEVKEAKDETVNDVSTQNDVDKEEQNQPNPKVTDLVHESLSDDGNDVDDVDKGQSDGNEEVSTINECAKVDENDKNENKEVLIETDELEKDTKKEKSEEEEEEEDEEEEDEEDWADWD